MPLPCPSFQPTTWQSVIFQKLTTPTYTSYHRLLHIPFNTSYPNPIHYLYIWLSQLWPLPQSSPSLSLSLSLSLSNTSYFRWLSSFKHTWEPSHRWPQPELGPDHLHTLMGHNNLLINSWAQLIKTKHQPLLPYLSPSNKTQPRFA
jgi:hypothetical protein